MPVDSDQGDGGPQPSRSDIALLEEILHSLEPLTSFFTSKAIQYPDPGEFEAITVRSLYDALTDLHKQLLGKNPLIRSRSGDLWKIILGTLTEFINSESFVDTISEVRSLKRAIDQERELTPREEKWMVKMINRLPDLAHELESIAQQLATIKNEWSEISGKVLESRTTHSHRN